ncbi:MAG: prepilin-type N-terminal cleavage/methylation domain-containing protein [Candidatus Riflebacteria bacterium]
MNPKNIKVRQGLTLIEIMISLVILAIVAGSVFSAFSGSRSMLASAREIAVATSLSGSYLAAAANIEATQIKVFAPIEDVEAPPAFRPEKLGIAPAPEPFKRKISILRLDETGKEGGPFYQLRVEISWPGKDGRIPVSYFSSNIIAGGKK